MDDDSAMRLWDFVLELSGNRWGSIEEVDPDDIDLQMFQETQNDPDCQTFS